VKLMLIKFLAILPFVASLRLSGLDIYRWEWWAIVAAAAFYAAVAQDVGNRQRN
jgi:hypothetical protein